MGPLVQMGYWERAETRNLEGGEGSREGEESS